MILEDIIQKHITKSSNIDERYELNTDSYKSIEEISNDFTKSFAKVTSKWARLGPKVLKTIVNSIETGSTEVPKVTFGLSLNNRDLLKLRVFINYRKLLMRRKYDHAALQKELDKILSPEGIWVGIDADGIITLSITLLK